MNFITDQLTRVARDRPHAPALFAPCGQRADGRTRYVHYTFQQLDRESDLLASGFTRLGIGPGVRTAVMVKPGLELFALTFALFKAGAIPVLIDPGIGIRNLKICLGEAEPAAFIGIPMAHAARVVLGWARRSIRRNITVGRRWFWGGITLADVRTAGELPFSRPVLSPDDMAAILFTSGSTGVPKGVVYDHKAFVAQVALIHEAFQATPGEVDLPTFPLFALFNPPLGITTVIPDMDPTRPARVNPDRILQAIGDFGVTQMFGSPALLDTVSRAFTARGIRLPTLRRILSAGAPVHAQIRARTAGLLEGDAQVWTPYGATEALPVSLIGSRELADTAEETARGGGICVGRPMAANRVHILPITEDPIPRWSDELPLPPDQIGEIVVQGPSVSRSYFHRDASTAVSKIHCEDGTFFHRMGDLGRFDPQGRLWFCGRKSHRVVTPEGTLYTICVEAVFNVHPQVYRTALVGVGGMPVLCVEMENGVSYNPQQVRRELCDIGARFDHTRNVRTFLFHPAFPVDIRHNAKIGREKLAIWAKGRI